MKAKLALVHGWGIGSSIWQHILKPLDSIADVSVVDLPGYGRRAEETFADSIDELAEDLLGQIGPGRVWVAWSLGSMIAMHAAVHHPESIAGLVLIGPTPKFSAAEDWSHGMQPGTIDELESRFKRDVDAATRRFVRLQFSNPRRDRSLVDRALRLIQQQSIPSLNTLSSGLELLRQTDLRSTVASIKCPVTLIAGTDDAIVPVTATQELAAMIDHAELHLLAAGHLPFIEQPQEVVRRITEAAT